MKRVAIFLIGLLLLVGSNAHAATVVDLEQFMSMVRENNPSLRAGIRSVEAAYFGVLASVSYQRPSVGITTTGTYLSGQEAGGRRKDDITAYDLKVGLSHRIDIAGRYTLDEQQQILNYENQRALFDRDVNNLMASAEQTFWAAILARENVALQKDVLRQRMENDRVTQEKYKQQLVPKLDIIRSEAQVVAAETAVTDAQAQYLNLISRMISLVGGAEVLLQDKPLAVPSFDVVADVDKALASRPDVRASKLALDRSKVVKKLTSKGMAPTLSLGINWVPLSDPWNSSSPQRGEFGGSLSLNIPVLDGNQTQYSVLNTDRLVLAAEASLESVKNVTKTDLAIALNNWESAKALERDRKRQVERSDEELRITELMYNEGMGAQIDLINAQTDNQAVRTNYLNAIRGMYDALVEIRRVLGDYAPDEDGTWKAAIVRYGRGGVLKVRNSTTTRADEKLSEQSKKSTQQNKSDKTRPIPKKKS